MEVGATVFGLALEGGGAKGAYHMGAIKALLEAGCTFGAVTGTSIGAVNGAILAQGSFEAGYRMWENLNTQTIFDLDDAQYESPMLRRFNRIALRQVTAQTKKVIVSRGIDTRKIRILIESIVVETRLREAKIDFGLVTVSLTDRKPLELYLDEIPHGKLVDYLLASASFPGFQPTRIDDKTYIDGGLYDNCPVNLLARKGITEVIAIRTLGPGITRQLKFPGTKVTEITPSEPLGSILHFDPALIRRNLQMGYYDALRQLRQLPGEKYYFEPHGLQEEECFALMDSVPDETMFSLGRMFGISSKEPRRLWREQLMPQLAWRMELPPAASVHAVLIRLAETLGEAKGLNKYAIYAFRDFIAEAHVGPLKYTANLSMAQVEMCMVAQKLFRALP